jgi:L-ascorbate metabolism protein UlaG (beta-lactamase superfamily)
VPKPLIAPVMQDSTLLDDIAQANKRDDHFRLWWLGQSGFLLQWNGRHMLMDPYLSDSLSRKYANTPIPHVRMTALPVKPERLNFVNLVTSSHIHTDHLDPDTLGPLLEANPKLKMVIPEAEREAVEDKLCVRCPTVVGLDQGRTVEIDGFRINAVPAAHESLELDSLGRCRFLGYVVEFGNWAIYHSGDTVLHSTLLEALRGFHIDVAILPINGRGPEKRVAGNLNAKEAAWLGREIRARAIIPCHYDMFAFNTAPVESFVAAACEIGQSYAVLRCGERWESSRFATPRDFTPTWAVEL